MNNITVVNREMIMDIISVFEDFLDSKGVTKEMIPNQERDEYEVEAEPSIIFGLDVEKLEDDIRNILRNNNIVAPTIFADLKVEVIEEGVQQLQVELINE